MKIEELYGKELQLGDLANILREHKIPIDAIAIEYSIKDGKVIERLVEYPKNK